MSEIKSDQLIALENRIEEVKNLLHELEESARQLREQEQHQEVNHLEDYLNETDKEVQALAVFKDEVVKEIKGLIERIKDKMHSPGSH